MGTHALHIFFFPFLAHGHLIPAVDMAKLFASKDVKATIITTPFYAPSISKSIEKYKTSAHKIDVLTIQLPPSEVSGLPDGCENVDTVPPSLFSKFCEALSLLQEPLEQLILEHHPDCVVADMFFPWTTDSATKFGIPRIVFHGACFFSMCATECMRLNDPYKNISSDTEPFVIPDLPGEIKMTKLQAPPFYDKGFTGMAKMMWEVKESEKRSYGVIANSFYELEKAYADYFRNELGRKAWHIGPLSLCNDSEEKAKRGKETSSEDYECLKWLDMKKPDSVVYICFGSMVKVSDSQLRDMAIGLEASGQQFIWVVRRDSEKELEEEKWVPEGFEKRIEGKGLIIRGWAPQVLILEHQAIGAFVTHCGWNSTLEGVTAGVPMITWPNGAEQFYNEKLVTEVIKTGVPVGVKKWARLVTEEESIKWDAIEKAVKKIMEGEEALEMRKRAKELSKLAKKAVEEGGSSYSNLNALIQELGSLKHGH